MKTRIVNRIPLEFLWKEHEILSFKRVDFLRKSQVETILKFQKIEFVIASIGNPLKWIETDLCYDFWKNELNNHLVEDHEEFYLDDFQNHYAYVASEWRDEEQLLILLEVFH